MTRSTMPTYFHESAEQSSSPELSDELTMALAEGRWWAIMEVSDPISAYEYPSSWQWRGTVEEEETSCPTSLVFSDKSANAQSPHSGFSDTLKTKKQWRQKETHGAPVCDGQTQGTPVPTRFLKRAPVLVSSAMGKPTSSLVYSDASLKTRDQQRIQRQKKPQGAPVPAESSREPPVPAGSQQRGKLIIPEYLIKHLQKAAFELGALLPAGSPPRAPMPSVSSQKILMRAKSPQRTHVPSSKVFTCSPHGETMPDKVPDRQKLQISEPLRREPQQQKPYGYSLQGVPVTNKISEKTEHKIPDPMRQEMLQQNPLASSIKGAPLCCTQDAQVVSDKIPERKRLKIPDLLRKELLRQKSLVSSIKGAPLYCTQNAQVVLDKIPERKRLKIPYLKSKELLQQKPYGYSLQGVPVTNKIPEKKDLKIPDPTRQEMLQQKPLASSIKGAPLCCTQDAQVVPDKIPKRKTFKNPDLLRKELLHQKPQVSSIQVASMTTKSPLDVPLPSSTPMGVSVNVRTPQEAAVPTESAAVPSRKIIRAKPRFTKHLKENLLNEPVPVSFTQEESMARRIPKGVSEHSGIPQHLRQQKPHAIILHGPFAHSHIRPISSLQRAPMSIRRKRLCPWSTEVSHDVGDSTTFTPKRFKPEPDSSEQPSTQLPADREESID